MANVLLLRSPARETPDPYEDCFKNLGYKPSSLPVLETVFINSDVLKRTIVTGPKAQHFSGVIITSFRACEAWGNVVKDVVQEPLDQMGQSLHIYWALLKPSNTSSKVVVYTILCCWGDYC
jgi:uroporphyrinogen-III synthase